MRVFKISLILCLSSLLFIFGNPKLYAEINGVCVANCPPYGGSSGNTGGGTPSGPTAEERRQAWEEQDLREAALDAYDTGEEFYEKGDWLNALKSFAEALEYTPGDNDIIDAINRAKKKLSDDDQRRRAKMKQDLENAATKNRPMQEAAAAAAHGKNAAASANRKESQKVFDIGGDKTKLPKFTPTTTVDTTGYKESLGRKVDVPLELQENPQILSMQKERKTLEGQFRGAEKQLAAIKLKKQEGKGDKGKLDMQEFKAKEKIDIIKQKVQTIDVKMESFVINLTQETGQSKKP